MAFDFVSETMNVVQGISADLAAKSALSGSSEAAAGQFQVDLAALYKHHNDVCDLYDGLAKKILTLEREGAANSYPASDIPGVQRALEKTWGRVVEGNESMFGGLRAVLNAIGNYANAVGDVYRSYIKADEVGASTLTAAGNPNAAKIPIGSSNAPTIVST